MYHPVLFISIEKVSKLNSFHPNLAQKAYNIRKANFITLYVVFRNVDWSFIYNFSDVNTKAFYSKLYGTLNAYIHLYKNANKKYSKRFTSEIMSNTKRKYKYYKKI